MNVGVLTHSFAKKVAERPLLWVGRVMLLVWAGFWLWFNAASAVLENDGTLWHVGLGVLTALLAVTCWIWPRVGGVIMILAGMLAARGFEHWAAFRLLALPAAAIGVVLILAYRGEPTRR